MTRQASEALAKPSTASTILPPDEALVSLPKPP
jgi:hypothetical protein